MQDEEKVKKAARKANFIWWQNNVTHSVVAAVLWLLIHQQRTSLSQMQISLSPIDSYPFQITALTGLKALFWLCFLSGLWPYVIIGAILLMLVVPIYVFLKLFKQDIEAIKTGIVLASALSYLVILWILTDYIP
jgi:hypothetical protein